MKVILRNIKSLLKGFFSLIGITLIDPIEIFFIPETNTFYPIISKSGCSSIKLILIRQFNPTYENVFPGIHFANPASLTEDQLRQLYFKTYYSYMKWARGKNMVFVMRDPISRFYSCYIDVKTGKNIMYQGPKLHWMMASRFPKNLSFKEFAKNALAIPDYLSDRHFRSQGFYLNQKVKNNLASLKKYTLEDYMACTQNSKSESTAVKLNANNESMPSEVKAGLMSNPSFQKRLKHDFALFETIVATKCPSSSQHA